MNRTRTGSEREPNAVEHECLFSSCFRSHSLGQKAFTFVFIGRGIGSELNWTSATLQCLERWCFHSMSSQSSALWQHTGHERWAIRTWKKRKQSPDLHSIFNLVHTLGYLWDGEVIESVLRYSLSVLKDKGDTGCKNYFYSTRNLFCVRATMICRGRNEAWVKDQSSSLTDTLG